MCEPLHATLTFVRMLWFVRVLIWILVLRTSLGERVFRHVYFITQCINKCSVWCVWYEALRAIIPWTNYINYFMIHHYRFWEDHVENKFHKRGNNYKKLVSLYIDSVTTVLFYTKRQIIFLFINGIQIFCRFIWPSAKHLYTLMINPTFPEYMAIPFEEVLLGWSFY